MSSASALGSPPGLRVKNTFIEGAALLSPSLETFYRERAVQTCPSKHAGRCIGLLEELAGEVPGTPMVTPLNVQTPCNIETPLADSLLRGQDCYGWRNSAYVAPCSTGQNHVGLPGLSTNLLAGGVEVPPVANDFSFDQATQQLGHGARTVLSLAHALGQDAVGEGAAQLGSPAIQCCPGSQQPFPLAGGRDTRFAAGAEPWSSVMDSAPQYLAPAMKDSTDPSKPPSGPALGSLELPSVGSAEHAAGRCKPCAFFHTKGCDNDLACHFCHICGPEVRRARKQEKLHQRREATRARKEKQAVRHCRSV